MRKRLVNKLCQMMLQSIKVTSSFVRRCFTPTFTFVLTGCADATHHLTCRRVKSNTSKSIFSRSNNSSIIVHVVP